MRNDERVWVIEDQERPEITSLGDAIIEAPRPNAPRPAPRRHHREFPAPRPASRPASAKPRKSARPVQSAILLALGYVLGPLALLLTARGRHSGLWMAFAASTLVLTTALGASWWVIAARSGSTSLLGPLLFGSLVCVVAVFTVWARALHLLVTSRRFPGLPWPAWVRSPWMAGLLGLVAPGSAWVFTRWPQRAAWTAWAIWPAAAAAFLLVQAPLLWHQRMVLAGWGLGADSLEWVFLFAGFVLLVTPLIWLTQALVAARAMARVAGRWQHGRGDWSAVALSLALIALVLAVQPVDLAAELDGGADVLQAVGCQVLPVHLTGLARRLDPGQPAYALQLANLHAARGEDEAAARVRENLARDLLPYVGELVREGAWGAMVEAALPRRTAPAVASVRARNFSAGEVPSALPAGLSLPGVPWPEFSDAPVRTSAATSAGATGDNMP